MEVRITYRSEVYIKGDNLKEIKNKWDEFEEGNATFVEICSVEDAKTYEDLFMEFINVPIKK